MRKNTFDQDQLTQRILQCFGTQKAFAEAMEMSPSALSNRLHNRTDWMYSEMQKAVSILELDRSDAECYFFTKVENTDTAGSCAHPGDHARRNLYFMSQELNDSEAIFLYTFASRFFYAGEFDIDSHKTRSGYLVECVLDGMEECKSEKAKKETA